MAIDFLVLIGKVAVVFNLILILASLAIWFERKVSALIQDRVGANRAGTTFYAEDVTDALKNILPGWILTPLSWIVLKPFFKVVRALGILGIVNTLVCDALKAILKEDFIPSGVSNFIHSLAPFMAVFPIFLSFALIPLAPDFIVDGYHVRMQVASLDAGILFIFAMGSIAVYGVSIAGWTGNNKFSLLGGLRAAAQMISYELAMGITLVTMILLFGTLDLYEMVEKQSGLFPYLPFIPNWGIFYQPFAFVILFVVGMAETKRAPFDLPEAESELAAGYFTEYSGMKFLLFWFGEFAEIGLFALIMTILFFGGWHIPYLELPENLWWAAIIGHVVLMTKVIALSILQVIIRWTLPRFRYDQLMTLGWKVLLPLAMANLVISAAAKIAF